MSLAPGADPPSATARRRRVPLWLMGLTNAPFGMYGGILVITIPELLNARHVPEEIISAMTAVTISPGFWSIIASPVLDVRFTRRAYATGAAIVAALLLTLGLLNLDHVGMAEYLLVAGFLAANLFQSALGGWLSSITAPGERNALSAWVSIANISGGGAMAVVAGEVEQRAPPFVAALTLGAALLAPIVIFPWMHAPQADRHLVAESFRRFAAEVLGVLRRREVLLALAMFVSPAASFALVNLLSGLGSDYHASAHFVGAVGGAGVLLAGVAGCLAFRLVDRLLRPVHLYLAIGVVGACFTLALMALPRTPASFAVALIGENVFQAAAMTSAIAIAFEVIGARNPLAATTFSVMVSVLNIPNTYMVMVDGSGYAWHGLPGALSVDAAASLMACALLLTLLAQRIRRRSVGAREIPQAIAPEADRG